MDFLHAPLRPLHCRHWWPLLLIAILAACAAPALQQDAERIAPSYAEPPATTGLLAEAAATIAEQHGPSHSGFYLLDGSHESLSWRLALIDSAVSSLDILTYLWYPDITGNLILERAMLAANRGVRVRLVIDDLMTMGQDQILADIRSHPNIELRLFNPWGKRNLSSRAGEMIAQMERLNTRMHNKLIIADSHATILGGRNIGDHYFGLNDSYNFHDLDVLAIGAIANDANDMFDHFWNSEWLVSAEYLTTQADAEKGAAARQRMTERNRSAAGLESFAREPKDWSDDVEALMSRLEPGTGYLVYDEVSAAEVNQSMITHMFDLFDRAEKELLITNAYIIPGKFGIEFLRSLTERGVDVRILTNSLASHDVPAVNSHYEKWRKPLIDAGVSLYEFRADPEIKATIDVPPTAGKFTGLHTKAAVIDHKLVFVGSMNLDPRSASINTEMGAIIESTGLAARLRELMLRDMRGENAWQVTLSESGRLEWVNSDETLSSQPARGFLQNVMNVIFKAVPKEQF
jgi:putative cardiolipin synthase